MARTQTPTLRREIEIGNLDAEDRALIMRRIFDLRGQIDHIRGHVSSLRGHVACQNELMSLDEMESELQDLVSSAGKALTSLHAIRRAS